MIYKKKKRLIYKEEENFDIIFLKKKRERICSAQSIKKRSEEIFWDILWGGGERR
jgi:hypothetical protein